MAKVSGRVKGTVSTPSVSIRDLHQRSDLNTARVEMNISLNQMDGSKSTTKVEEASSRISQRRKFQSLGTKVSKYSHKSFQRKPL